MEKAAAEARPAGTGCTGSTTAAEHEQLRSLVVSLAVEPLPSRARRRRASSSRTRAGLQLLTVMRAIADLKSKLQRTNPVEAQQKYNQMFSELVVLEARRKQLQIRSIGAQD